MKAEELAVIKERAEKATEGPWGMAADGSFHSKTTHHYVLYTPTKKAEIVGTGADLQFIANARQDVPKLVAEVERLQSEKAMLLNALQSINALCEATENIRQHRELLLIDEIAFDVLNEVDDE